MVKQLSERKNKFISKLNELEKQPQSQAEKKGQISESLRVSENEKQKMKALIEEIDAKINTLQSELNENQEKNDFNKRKKS